MNPIYYSAQEHFVNLALTDDILHREFQCVVVLYMPSMCERCTHCVAHMPNYLSSKELFSVWLIKKLETGGHQCKPIQPNIIQPHTKQNVI